MEPRREEDPEQDPTREQLIRRQQVDPTLAKIQEWAHQEKIPAEVTERVYFYWDKGLLYRHWHPKEIGRNDVRASEQLVLPKHCRAVVLRLAHEIPMGGHLGVTKTKDHILRRYYWPGLYFQR